MRLGALEAGGTKMVCAVGDENGTIWEQMTCPTTTPEETIPPIIEFFRQQQVQALGIASFGPLDLRPESETWGYITTTPKPGWGNYNLCGAFSQALSVPVGFDTDVNGSCLGEMLYGKAKDCASAVYVTVGTGIGMGICADGRLIHGMLHPEAGHMLVKRLPEDDFPGICPFHGDCLEGLCSGKAIGARYGVPAYEIPADDAAWRYTAYYLAQALVNLILIVSPERILLGGGVMKQPQLLPMLREQVSRQLAGYLKTPQLKNLETYITQPGCAGAQGILGALELARQAARDDKTRKL